MKRYLLCAIAVVLLSICTFDANAQCSKNCKNCKGNSKTENTMTMNAKSDKSLSCKLTSPELRKRKEEVIAKLKKQVLERKELANGYSYKFNGSDEMIDSLTAFIKSERQCCDFFNFSMTVTNDSFIWLEISGQQGAKEFIEAELEM